MRLILIDAVFVAVFCLGLIVYLYIVHCRKVSTFNLGVWMVRDILKRLVHAVVLFNVDMLHFGLSVFFNECSELRQFFRNINVAMLSLRREDGQKIEVGCLIMIC